MNDTATTGDESDLDAIQVRLRDAETLLQAVSRQTKVGLVVLGADHGYRFANQAYVDILGLPTGDLVGRPIATILPDVYDAQVRPHLERALSGEMLTCELVRSPPGFPAERRCSVTYLPGREGEGDPVATVVIHELIAQHEVARRLRESEERFRAAVQAVQGVVWTNDAEGRMSGEQPGWFALTGQGFYQYQGYGWASAVHPDDAQPTVDAWSAAVAERRPFLFEHRVRCRGGDHRRFAIRAVPLFNPDGSIREWVGVHTDVTDRHERERRDNFLLSLSDLLVQSATAEEACAGVARLLGHELGAGRTAYAEVDEDAGTLTVSREHLAPGMPSTAGTYRLEDLGPSVDHYRRGQPLVVGDTRADPRTAPDRGPSAYEAASTLALLDIPLIRNGRLVAILAVNHPEARTWTHDEIDLVRTTAERSWDAFESTRAEKRIREINATLERRVAEAVDERNRLWDVSEDLFVIANFEGRLLEVSSSWTRVLGWDREALARKNYEDLIDPEELGLARERLTVLLQTGGSVAYENRVLTLGATGAGSAGPSISSLADSASMEWAAT